MFHTLDICKPLVKPRGSNSRNECATLVDPDNHIGFSSSPDARLPDIFKNIEFPSNLFSCFDVSTQPLEGPPNCKIRQIFATLSQDIRPTFL